MSPRAITEHQFAAGNMTTGSTTACDGDASLTDNRNACVGGDMEAAEQQPTRIERTPTIRNIESRRHQLMLEEERERELAVLFDLLRPGNDLRFVA